MRQGAVADCLYIIYHGSVEVVREQNNEVIAVLKKNSVFGEAGIQNEAESLRSATIRVSSDELIGFRLGKSDY
jgi:CRP-like cAMP-binding protein